MKIMVVYSGGTFFAAVSTSRKRLDAWRDRFDNVEAWRLNDGSGWADGSIGSHEVINGHLPKAEVLLWN